jgi:hypothetical protein
LAILAAGNSRLFRRVRRPAFCATFAERVREAVEVARLSVQGQTISVTVSIGLASVPTDQVSRPGRCSSWPGMRMHEAMRLGGNARSPAACCLPRGRFRFNHALELLAANRAEPVIPHLPALGRALVALAATDESGIGFELCRWQRSNVLLSERKPEKISPFSIEKPRRVLDRAGPARALEQAVYPGLRLFPSAVCQVVRRRQDQPVPQRRRSPCRPSVRTTAR